MADSTDSVKLQMPDDFGRFRRWWYSRHPLRPHLVCPVTLWRHTVFSDSGPLGDAHCTACGKRFWIEYGR